jgi:hypothetical protein
MPFHFGDILGGVNLLVLLGIWRKLSIKDYQHRLMWADFAHKKGLDPNGKAKAAEI